MSETRIPQYIKMNPYFVKLQQILAFAKNEDTSVEMNQHFVKLQKILAYVKNEDTSANRDESTFRKITIYTSVGQK